MRSRPHAVNLRGQAAEGRASNGCGRPGTFNACGLRDRLDYIFISHSLRNAYLDGQIYRKGLWGNRKTRPDKWDTYPEMTASVEQASDHAAVVITLDL